MNRISIVAAILFGASSLAVVGCGAEEATPEGETTAGAEEPAVDLSQDVEEDIQDVEEPLEEPIEEDQIDEDF